MYKDKKQENINEKPIQKPITMVISDTKIALSNVINESGLPIYIIESMIKELANECKKLLEIYSKQEEEQYISTIKNEEQKKDPVD